MKTYGPDDPSANDNLNNDEKAAQAEADRRARERREAEAKKNSK